MEVNPKKLCSIFQGKELIMREITLEELLEAGCHFGHQVTRQNTKARDFIFEARDNIHIIDLAKTKEGLDAAAAFIRDVASKGGCLIIIGSKRQARGIVEEEFKRAAEEVGNTEGLFIVTNRWIGGTLTNFSEVTKNYKKLKDLGEKLKNDEEKAKYTKKEVGGWEKDRIKLERYYGGTQNMLKLPDALFIIDTHLEDLVVKEALMVGVPTVGITDTNSDPTIIDYPIPANDDAIGSIQLIVHHIVDALIEGRKEGLRIKEEGLKNEEKPAVTEEKAEPEAKKKTVKIKKEKVVKKKTTKKS